LRLIWQTRRRIASAEAWLDLKKILALPSIHFFLLYKMYRECKNSNSIEDFGSDRFTPRKYKGGLHSKVDKESLVLVLVPPRTHKVTS